MPSSLPQALQSSCCPLGLLLCARMRPALQLHPCSSHCTIFWHGWKAQSGKLPGGVEVQGIILADERQRLQAQSCYRRLLILQAVLHGYWRAT